MNVYCHFPFCRRKCAYCALHSRAGASRLVRDGYARRLAAEIRERIAEPITTIYFGGGTPAMCDLEPVMASLSEKTFATKYEFTVELHPADVLDDPALLDRLAAGGVNRISMGFEALDDATLRLIGRTHSAADAKAAFRAAKLRFPNCGFDVIAGLPLAEGATRSLRKKQAALADVLAELEPRHVSVYSLIREPATALDMRVRRGEIALPGDDAALDEVAALAATLENAGLGRYEISNYALPGAECRHNLAVWRGEDYLGLGEGAHGRSGRKRTVGERLPTTKGEGWRYSCEELSEVADALERELFSLRTCLGFNPEAVVARHPALAPRLDAWRKELDFNVQQGLLRRVDSSYTLTSRGYEVCDAILERLLG